MNYYFIKWWTFYSECWCNGLLKCVPFTYQKSFLGTDTLQRLCVAKLDWLVPVADESQREWSFPSEASWSRSQRCADPREHPRRWAGRQGDRCLSGSILPSPGWFAASGLRSGWSHAHQSTGAPVKMDSKTRFSTCSSLYLEAYFFSKIASGDQIKTQKWKFKDIV